MVVLATNIDEYDKKKHSYSFCMAQYASLRQITTLGGGDIFHLTQYLLFLVLDMHYSLWTNCIFRRIDAFNFFGSARRSEKKAKKLMRFSITRTSSSCWILLELSLPFAYLESSEWCHLSVDAMDDIAGEDANTRTWRPTNIARLGELSVPRNLESHPTAAKRDWQGSCA